MKRGAEEEARRVREAAEEVQRREEERRQRARARVVPPFKEALAPPSPAAGGGAVVAGELGALDEMTRSLIARGLIVPKWHLEKEPLANPLGNMTGREGIVDDTKLG